MAILSRDRTTSMNNFSENWKHLKSILTGYETRSRHPDVTSFEELRHAKAFSIFLANAKLATPTLNRDNIEQILAAKFQWPSTSGESFAGTDIPLSQFENLGLVSFYGEWCATHCYPLRDLDSIDPTLVPLIKAVNHLQDIKYGQNGCIRPHYRGREVEIRRLLSAEFGDHLTVEELLPELEYHDEFFTLPPGNKNFCSLISTHLWLTLRRTKSPEEAFSLWMMCFRVNCDWAMPVIFEQQQYKERNEFDTQLLKFLAEDTELQRDIDFYIRQSINETEFSRLIRPMALHMGINLKDQNSPTSIRERELPKTTLSSLESVYPNKIRCSLNNLEFVVNIQNLRMHGESELFYSWLLSRMVDDNILIQGQSLSSSDFIEDLMGIADNRPILKYILFIVLPRYELSNYLVWLLANSKTCDIALYYLTKKTFEHSHSPSSSYVWNLEEGYQQLVCYEYVRSITQESDFDTRLLSALEMLGNQCDFRYSTFSKGLEYRFFLNLLGAVENQQVVMLAQLFSKLPVQIESSCFDQSRQQYKYLLGFWLIERLDTSGIDPSGGTRRALCESILKYYGNELTANLTGLSSLRANAFFATLPWGKLIAEVGPSSLLALSNKCDDWRTELAYGSSNPFDVASAVCQYLQVLMCLGRPTSSNSPLHGVASRVQEIVRSCGFGTREKFVQLFEERPVTEKYDLWETFCSYANTFRDDLYEEFVTRCIPSIPLDNLFVLLKKCTVISRTRRLHEVIDARQIDTNDDLGMDNLEQAFISACDFGRTETATQLLELAKSHLAQEPFLTSKHRIIVERRKIWQSYEYKWQLLMLCEAHKSDPPTFEKLVHEISIPHEMASSRYSPDHAHYDECEYFRRQIIAMILIETDPARSIGIMQNLYKETKRDHHGVLLLYGHLKLYAIDKDRTRLQHALAHFFESTKSIDPKSMSDFWVATILDVYRILNTHESDHFWMKLSTEQQTQLQILKPYCSALIERGDSFTVRKIIARYQELNQSTPDDLDIDDLISELANVEADKPSMKDLIQQLNESSQRTIVQLRKHYSQIISKDFETYVEIVKPDQLPHEYLKDVVLAVARELVLRKRNLQIEFDIESGARAYRIMLEDWINDWFTSLFDHRMSQAQIGFRDQKRGGRSASGKNPGEIDGFITSSNNARIAIFEAFRLLSFDITVISKHLNKIAGYDAESLSPVFVVAYCDVIDFAKLVTDYEQYISGLKYTGYSIAEGSLGAIEVLENTDHIWLGTEIRRRGRKDIIFYHLLINLHFSH